MRILNLRLGSLGASTGLALFWFAACGGSSNSGLGHGNYQPDGSTATGGATGSAIACTRTSECSSRTDGLTICDTHLGECVACASGDDCGLTKDCIRSTCWPITTCEDSR